MQKKRFSKKVVRTVRNSQFESIPLFLRVPLIFLATIGDTVIYGGFSILRILKIAFSIYKHLLLLLVHFLKKLTRHLKLNKKKTYSHTQIIHKSKGLIFTRRSYQEIVLRNIIILSRLYLKVAFFTKSLRLLLKSSLHFLIFLFLYIRRITKRFFIHFIRTFITLVKSLIKLPKIPGKYLSHLFLTQQYTMRLPRIRFPHLKVSVRISPLFLGMILGSFLVFFLVFIPYNFYTFVKQLPHPKLLSQRVIPITTQIYDRKGNLLYEIHGDEDRKPLPLTEVPKIVKDATIAIEDKDFYHHFGFSITAIARAARETFVNKNTQGGSTITQQLIKTALLTPEITLKRKLREVLLAFWAERIYSKDQILEMYLNQVPYGGTAWGIEAAAESYFGKRVADLSLGEAAYLAGLPAAPSYYSPYGTHPEYAYLRQKEVLGRMLDDHKITQTQYDEAVDTDIIVKPNLVNINAPHFVMYVKELLIDKYGQKLVDQGGLRVTTTLDLDLQEKIQKIVSRNVKELSQLHVGNGAALVTNPKNGDVLAMIGSRDYFDTNHDGNVNVTLAPRQPGSSIKPLMYAAALEKGFTAATILEDTPISFQIPGQVAYAPVNYDSRFHGSVTLRTALGSSYNITAVKTLNRIGVKSLIETAKKMGISTWTNESRFGLALTLGGGETTLLDMVTAYGVLANGGIKVNLDPILTVTDYTGKTYYKKSIPQGETVLSSGISFIISDILADNSARTPAFGPHSQLVIPGKTVAVKTGTTNEKRDNLTFGYTPSFVVGVWVGNNDNTPMNPVLTSGVTGAAPIWNQIMIHLLSDKKNEPFAKPSNVISIPCFGRNEYFVEGTQPKRGCGVLPSSPPSPSPRAI